MVRMMKRRARDNLGDEARWQQYLADYPGGRMGTAEVSPWELPTLRTRKNSKFSLTRILESYQYRKIILRGDLLVGAVLRWKRWERAQFCRSVDPGED